MQLKKYRKSVQILIIFALSFSLCSCDFINPVREEVKNALCFDTIISISIYDSNKSKADKLLEESMGMCYEYEKMFSASIPSSDFSKINTSKSETVNVNPQTAQLINESLKYSELSDGLFDISVESVTKLWDFHGNSNTVPDQELISEAEKHVNYKNIKVSGDNTVTIADADAQIEAGGLAKGFIADKIADYLLTQNVQGAVINMGGDMRLIGKPAGKETFSIGINDPNNSGSPLFPIFVTNTSVATSGTYERSFTLNDKLYHHILDPKTGYPCNTDVVQATVVTDSSMAADALATICILKGSKEALNLIESLDNTEAIIITDSGLTLYTSGMNKYLINSQ